MKVTLLNTSILTNYGIFDYNPLTLKKVRQIIHKSEVISAVGHKETAIVLSNLLGVEILNNRFEYKQQVGDIAIVFKLNSRIPEGKILNRKEIEEIGYEFGILRRLK